MPRRTIYVDGKAVYTVSASGALQKRFRSNHILNKPRGLAVDVPVLREAADMGADRCEFVHMETGDVYSAPLAWLTEHGIYLNRGYGPQRALPLEYWRINGQEPTKRPRAIVEAEKPPARPPEAVQVSLFSMAGGAG
jgi:hypothetical protein